MIHDSKALRGLLVLLVLFLFTSASADTVKLKNGTSVEGVVIKFGDEYRVKQADGTTKIVKEKDVAGIEKGSGAGHTMPTPPSGGSAGMANALKSANAAQTVEQGLVVWQQFIAGKPSATELKLAEDELQRWQKRIDDKFVNFDGTWVTPDEREAIEDALILATWRRSGGYRGAGKAWNDAITLLSKYPRSFEASFSAGMINVFLTQSNHAPAPGLETIPGSEDPAAAAKLEAAIVALKRAAELKPDSFEAWGELSIAYRRKWRIAEALNAAIRSYRLRPGEATKLIVAAAIHDGEWLASRMKGVAPFEAQLDQAISEFGPGREDTGSLYVPLESVLARRPSPPARAEGQLDLGTGFLVTDRGHIIIPKTLLREGADVWVYRKRWWLKPAATLAVDPGNNLALLKVEHSRPLPFLKLRTLNGPLAGSFSANFASYAIAAGDPDWTTTMIKVTAGEIAPEVKQPEITFVLNGAVAGFGAVSCQMVEKDGALSYTDSTSMQAFLNANRGKLDGAAISIAAAGARDTDSTSTEDGIVLVFITEKGSPPPAGPTTQPLP